LVVVLSGQRLAASGLQQLVDLEHRRHQQPVVSEQVGLVRLPQVGLVHPQPHLVHLGQQQEDLGRPQQPEDLELPGHQVHLEQQADTPPHRRVASERLQVDLGHSQVRLEQQLARLERQHHKQPVALGQLRVASERLEVDLGQPHPSRVASVHQQPAVLGHRQLVVLGHRQL
jgi:hypothetical protein